MDCHHRMYHTILKTGKLETYRAEIISSWVVPVLKLWESENSAAGGLSVYFHFIEHEDKTTYIYYAFRE